MPVQLDEACEALLSPVLTVVEKGLDALGWEQPLRVRIGDTRGFWTDQGDVVLSSKLVQGVHHPDESKEGPLDRWRRAAASVLEAAAARRLSAKIGVMPDADWRWAGAAVDDVDRAVPELQLAAPELWGAVTSGDPGTYPRTGVAAIRAISSLHPDPKERVEALLAGILPSEEEWSAWGRWVFSPLGARSDLRLAPPLIASGDIPMKLGPWRWVRLRVPAHPRGGELVVRGQGIVDPAWARGGVEHSCVASTTVGCVVEGEPGGPIGAWEVASAHAFGQVIGVRGVSFRFEKGGTLCIVLADAFVGGLQHVSVGDEVGTSGVVTGRWSVAHPNAVRLADIRKDALTMHQRQSGGFAMPAGAMGVGEWLAALTESPWSWSSNAGRLVMIGEMMGGKVEIRLRRE